MNQELVTSRMVHKACARQPPVNNNALCTAKTRKHEIHNALSKVKKKEKKKKKKLVM